MKIYMIEEKLEKQHDLSHLTERAVAEIVRVRVRVHFSACNFSTGMWRI